MAAGGSGLTQAPGRPVARGPGGMRMLNVPLGAFTDQRGTLVTSHVANVPRCY